MLNFNNTLTSRIISLIIAVSFLLTDLSYAGVSQQGSLRVPVGEELTYERAKEVMRMRGRTQSSAAATPADGLLHQERWEHRAWDAFQQHKLKFSSFEIYDRASYATAADHFGRLMAEKRENGSIPASVTVQEWDAIREIFRGITSGAYKIYGFQAIVYAPDDYLLGYHDWRSKEIFVAENFVSRLVLAETDRFWNTYLEYMVCYPVVGSERAMEILRDLYPELFYESGKSVRAVSSTIGQGYLGAKIQRFVERSCIHAGASQRSAQENALVMLQYAHAQMERLSEFLGDHQQMFTLWQRTWVDLRNLNTDIFDFYEILVQKDKGAADTFFTNATTMMVGYLTAAPFPIDPRYFTCIAGNPLKMNDRITHAYLSALDVERGMPRIEENVEWDETVPVIGWDIARWDFEYLTPVISEGLKRKEARLLFFSEADIVSGPGVTHVYVGSGIGLDEKGGKVFLIFKKPVRLDVAVYRDDEAYSDSITRIEPCSQQGRLLSSRAVHFLLDKAAQWEFFSRSPDLTPMPDTTVVRSKPEGILSSAEASTLVATIQGFMQAHPQNTVVIKPMLGYGSRWVSRFYSGQRIEAFLHAISLVEHNNDIIIQRSISTDRNVRAFIYRQDNTVKTVYLVQRGFAGFVQTQVEENLIPDERAKLDQLSNNVYTAVEAAVGEDPVLISADLIFDENGKLLILEVNPGFFSFTDLEHSHGRLMPVVARDIFNVLLQRAQKERTKLIGSYVVNGAHIGAGVAPTATAHFLETPVRDTRGSL